MESTHLLGTRVGKTVSGPGDGVASKPSGVPAPRMKNQQARDVIAGGGNSESRRKSKASLGEGEGGVLRYIWRQEGA